MNGYLAVCEQDQFGRPIAILLNFCNVKYKEDDTSIDYDDQIDLTMHELTHGLIFNMDYFKQFRDSNGNSIPFNQVVSYIDDEAWIISSTVKATAQQHFSCPTLPGALLDASGYHWSGRMLNTLITFFFLKYKQKQ